LGSQTLVFFKKSFLEKLKESRKWKAEGETKKGKWFFERSRNLLNYKIIAKKQNKIAGKCSYGPWMYGEIKLGSESFIVRKKYSFLHYKYILVDEEGLELMIFGKLLRRGVQILIKPEAKKVKNLPLLMVFFFYLLNIHIWETRQCPNTS